MTAGSDIERVSTSGSGDVVGPASSVDNTIPRFNGITGKLLQTSGIVIDDSDAMTFNNAAAPSILSVEATATVPTIVPNKTDLDTGIGWAAANALSLISGATEALRITQTPTGAGQTVASLIHIKTAVLGKDTTNEVAFSLNYTTNKLTSGSDTGLLINMTDTASPGTSLLIDAQKGGASKFKVDNEGGFTSSGGLSYTVATQTLQMPSDGKISPSNSASGLTLGNDTASAVARTIIKIAGELGSTSGTNYPLKINPIYNQTSGTAANTDLLINRTETAVGSGAQLLIDAQVASYSYFAISNKGKMIVPTTITAPGTTGDQTINKLAGRVNIAAAGTTITVTNSLVTVNSIIVATAATNDTTAMVKNVVAAAGSFVINVVGVTAETAINFMVIS